MSKKIQISDIYFLLFDFAFKRPGTINLLPQERGFEKQASAVPIASFNFLQIVCMVFSAALFSFLATLRKFFCLLEGEGRMFLLCTTYLGYVVLLP